MYLGGVVGTLLIFRGDNSSVVPLDLAGVGLLARFFIGSKASSLLDDLLWPFDALVTCTDIISLPSSD